MKIYTLGNHGFVTPSVTDALGSPRAHAQARVFIPATSKAEAARLSTSCGVTADRRDPQLREAAGDALEALIDAGIVQPGAIYIIRLDGPHSPLIRLAPGGTLTVLGLVLAPPATPGQTRFGRRPRRFYPLPDADQPRPELSATEQKLIETSGYADRWARWDQTQKDGDPQ